MARRGHPGMAVSACFGAPIAISLAGVGFSYMTVTAALPGNEFTFQDGSGAVRDVLLFAALLLVMLATLLAGTALNHFASSAPLAAVLFLFYGISLVLIPRQQQQGLGSP